MRVFLAIPIMQNVVQDLAALLSDHKPALEQAVEGRLVYVAPELYHLTVKFCGEIDVDQLDTLKHTIKEVLISHKPHQLETNQIVGIPHHQPRIIGVSMRQNQTFNALLESVSQALDTSGLLDTRLAGHKQPHVTLARVKGASHFDAVLPIDTHSMIMIDRVILYASELSDNGPIYTPLETFML